MSDYVDTVDIEGTQYDIQDTATKEQAEENTQNIQEVSSKVGYIGQAISGTIVSGINIATGGASGNVMRLTIPKGKWLLFSNGWIPAGCYLTCNVAELSAGVISTNQQLANACGYFEATAETVAYMILTNWSESPITSFTGNVFIGVRIG